MKILKVFLCLLFLLTGVTQRVSAQYFGVGCNAALLATGTLNVALDAAFAPHWSAELSLMWNPVKSDKLQLNILAVQPGVRYWIFEEYAGHFLGANITAAKYRIGNNRIYHRGWLTGVGLSYGYAWLLSPRWNLSIEAGVGIFYMQEQQRDHNVPLLEDEYIRHTRRYAVGPSKCAVSFTYLF